MMLVPTLLLNKTDDQLITLDNVIYQEYHITEAKHALIYSTAGHLIG